LIAFIDGRGEFPFRREFPVEVTLRGTTGPAPGVSPGSAGGRNYPVADR
jgi:hypothetical protein